MQIEELLSVLLSGFEAFLGGSGVAALLSALVRVFLAVTEIFG